MINNWTETLLKCGIPENYLTKKHGPCPFCGGKDRFRYTDYKGAGMYICNQCGEGNGYTFLQQWHNISYIEALKMTGEYQSNYNPELVAQRLPERIKKEENKTAKAELVGYMRQLQFGHNTCVQTYLESRGIPYPLPFSRLMKKSDGSEHVCDFCAFLLPEYKGWIDGNQITTPAMAWKIVNPITMQVVGLHCTLLNEDGTVPPYSKTKMFTKSLTELEDGHYKVIPLTDDDDAKWCVLAEGIETALSARLMRGDENILAFAAGNAGMMTKFVPYDSQLRTHNAAGEEIKRICHDYREKNWIVLGDNDVSRTGQHAAFIAAARIGKSLTPTKIDDRIIHGREKTFVAIPKEVGDWNDYLNSEDPTNIFNHLI